MFGNQQIKAGYQYRKYKDLISFVWVFWRELGFGKKACEKQCGIFVCEEVRTRKRVIFFFFSSWPSKWRHKRHITARPIFSCHPNSIQMLSSPWYFFIWISLLGREQRHKDAHRNMQWCEHTLWRKHLHTYTRTDIRIYEIYLSVLSHSWECTCPYPHTSHHHKHVHRANHTYSHVYAPKLQCKLGSVRTINQ